MGPHPFLINVMQTILVTIGDVSVCRIWTYRLLIESLCEYLQDVAILAKYLWHFSSAISIEVTIAKKNGCIFSVIRYTLLRHYRVISSLNSYNLIMYCIYIDSVIIVFILLLLLLWIFTLYLKQIHNEKMLAIAGDRSQDHLLNAQVSGPGFEPGDSQAF